MVKKGQPYSSQTSIEDLSSPLITRIQSQTFVGQRIERDNFTEPFCKTGSRSKRVRRTLAKFGLPFEKATPLVHFPKALKGPRKNAGPAGIELLIMKGVGFLIMKGIWLMIYEINMFLIMKGFGLLIMKGIELLIMKGIRVLNMKGIGF